MIQIKVNNWFQLLMVVSFIYSSHSQWVQEDTDACTTPNNLPGDCVVIKSCAPIVLQLETAPKPLPSSLVVQLQRSQCGFEGNQVKVCCPREVPTVQPPVSETFSEAPPDISQHRNLGLLRGDICGANLDDRILNGNKTGVFEFPWMVLIAYNTRTGLSFRCGGTLISDKYVLTAAHCITNLRSTLTLAGVRLGEHNINTDPDCEGPPSNLQCAPAVQDFGIEKVISHPDYNPARLQHDIGLIRLTGSADYSADTVRPICLPMTPELQRLDLSTRQVVVAGWGATETGLSSPDLLKVEIPIVSNVQCGGIYNKSAPIGFRQMCAGGVAGRDSCGGDSGGPLKFVSAYMRSPRYIQHGIVSFGPRRCGTEGQPGVYTRVAYYMDWILNQMEP